MNILCVICGVAVEACCTICGDPVCDKHALGHDRDAHGLGPEDVRTIEPHELDQAFQEES